MIQKVSTSVVMDKDMKVSGKITKGIAKVRKRDLLIFFDSNIFDVSKGKWVGNNGIMYEG